MSDFQIGKEQRAKLLAGSNAALEFDVKPFNDGADRGVEPGDRYVLAWKRATATAYEEDGFVAHTPKEAVWFITVTKVKRGWKPDADPPRMVWTVSFEMTDRRDTDLWLSHSGDYQFSPRGAVDELPVAPSDETRLKAIQERDHLARLQRHAAKQRAKARAKRARRAA